MSKFSKIYCGAALSILLSSTASFADVTNSEVWGNWRSYMENFGYSITANEAASGNTLTVTDIAMTIAFGENNDSVSVVFPSVTFDEIGDGSVNIALPPLSEIAISTSLETGEEINAVVGYAQDGLNMNVTGENGDFIYAYTADGINVSLQELKVDGEDIGPDIAKVNVRVNNITGNASITSGDLRTYTQNLNSGSVIYDLAFSEPEGEGAVKLNGKIQQINSNSVSTLPKDGLDVDDLNAMFESGFASEGTLTYQGGNMEVSFSSPEGAGTASSSSSGGAINFALGQNGIEYGVSQSDLAVNALMPDIPFPIAVNMALSKFNMTLPIKKSDAEQDFAFGFTMGDFTMSDAIWSLFDPAGELPRDPATIALDLAGKAKILFDFLDPDQAAALESSGAAPGELNTLTLKQMVVDAVGAQLTGTGDFTFDNSDLVSFDGMPRPSGAIDLKLVGGNGLLDKLVEMGMIPQEQAMGARLMMGLFAVADEGTDTLNSKIEINDDGHILANGQRIR